MKKDREMPSLGLWIKIRILHCIGLAARGGHTGVRRRRGEGNLPAQIPPCVCYHLRADGSVYCEFVIPGECPTIHRVPTLRLTLVPGARVACLNRKANRDMVTSSFGVFRSHPLGCILFVSPYANYSLFFPLGNYICLGTRPEIAR